MNAKAFVSVKIQYIFELFHLKYEFTVKSCGHIALQQTMIMYVRGHVLRARLSFQICFFPMRSKYADND